MATIRKLIASLAACGAILGLTLGLLAACSPPFAEDIAKVKAAQTGGVTNEELVKEVAGVRGTITWRARNWTKSEGKIVLVEAAVERVTKSGAKREIVLQFLRNRGTEKIALDDVLVDGESQGLIGGALQMFLLQLE
jgi:hypothetical protein